MSFRILTYTSRKASILMTLPLIPLTSNKRWKRQLNEAVGRKILPRGKKLWTRWEKWNTQKKKILFTKNNQKLACSRRCEQCSKWGYQNVVKHSREYKRKNINEMLMSSILIKIPIVLYEGTKSKFDSNSSSQGLKITAREFWKLVYVIYFRDKDKVVWRTTVD